MQSSHTYLLAVALLFGVAGCQKTDAPFAEQVHPIAFGTISCGPNDGGAYELFIMPPESTCKSLKSLRYEFTNPTQTYTAITLLNGSLNASQAFTANAPNDEPRFGGIACTANQSCSRIDSGRVFISRPLPHMQVILDLQFENNEIINQKYQIQDCSPKKPFTCP